MLLFLKIQLFTGISSEDTRLVISVAFKRKQMRTAAALGMGSCSQLSHRM